MLIKSLPKPITLSITFLIILTVLLLNTNTAMADGGGHLWFYSQDPDTLPGPQPLPDPEIYDPKYVGVDPDPWVSESVVIPPEDWTSPFNIWLGCRQFESLETQLVVSINDEAYNAIQSITINGNPLNSWDTSGDPPGCLAPHGVFNSADFYGYASIGVGDLYSPPGSLYKVLIVVEIMLNGQPSSDMKIHFDAYGHTENDSCIFSPYSHDLTFVIPELAPVLMAASSFIAFAVYVYKYKK